MAGQPLFRLSSENYAEALKEAEANFKQAQVELEMANYETERIQRLVEKQIFSSIRLDQVRREQEVVRMKVEQARAQMQRAQMDYSYTTITSPFTGYVDRIPYKAGSLVNPESLLTTVSDISEVFAYYKVNESEYLRFKRAQLKGENLQQMDNVELVLPDGSIYAHKGKQETVEGDFERGTGSIAFRVRFPNPDGLLKHGVTGKVRMMTRMFAHVQHHCFTVSNFNLQLHGIRVTNGHIYEFATREQTFWFRRTRKSRWQPMPSATAAASTSPACPTPSRTAVFCTVPFCGLPTAKRS